MMVTWIMETGAAQRVNKKRDLYAKESFALISRRQLPSLSFIVWLVMNILYISHFPNQ